VANNIETIREDYTILIVDDDESVVLSLGRQLMRHINLLIATSVQDAKALLSSQQDIDVIATDLRMPGKDGLDLLRYARRNYPKIRRILFTGFVDPLKIQEAVRDVGVTAMMFKPLDPKELLAYTNGTHPAMKDQDVDRNNVWR
jgi:response regulator RpfG family c-di-GMP phosphodiesterase